MIKSSNTEVKYIYYCNSKKIANDIKKILKENKNITIKYISIKNYKKDTSIYPNIYQLMLKLKFLNKSDKIQTDNLLRLKYNFISFGLYKLIKKKE